MTAVFRAARPSRIVSYAARRTARGALEAAYPEVKIYRTELAQRIAHAEAAAARRSVLEYAPHSLAAEEIRALAREVWRDVE